MKKKSNVYLCLLWIKIKVIGAVSKICKILKITMEDLLNGEIVNMNNYNERNEKLLLEMVKQKEDNDR